MEVILPEAGISIAQLKRDLAGAFFERTVWARPVKIVSLLCLDDSLGAIKMLEKLAGYSGPGFDQVFL
jgi:hypothetical protein